MKPPVNPVAPKTTRSNSRSSLAVLVGSNKELSISWGDFWIFSFFIFAMIISFSTIL